MRSTGEPFGRARLLAARGAARLLAADWRGADAYRSLVARFDALPAGDADTVAASATALLAEADWVGVLLAPLLAAVGGDHAVEPPLRVMRDRLRIGAILFDHPAVSISAAVLSGRVLAALPPPPSVVVPGCLTIVRYQRAGGARWRGWDAGPVAPDFTAATAVPLRPLPDRPLRDGEVVRYDGRVAGALLLGAGGAGDDDVVTVTALVRPGAAPLAREYALPAGTLLRVAAVGEETSRTHMLLTLLRFSGRADAASCFEEATRSAAFHLRWSAMREWLALDVAAALPRLTRMAATDPHPEVRAAARATLPMTRERRAA